MLAAVLTLAACGSAPDEPARRARPALETLTVESSVASNARVWDGVVSAERESLLSSQTAGRVTDVAVDIGDRVTRGQSLLSISAVEQQAGVNAAVAQVKAADAALAEAELAFKRAAELVLLLRGHLHAGRKRHGRGGGESDEAGLHLVVS